jgi:hypothetical protein
MSRVIAVLPLSKGSRKRKARNAGVSATGLDLDAIPEMGGM